LPSDGSIDRHKAVTYVETEADAQQAGQFTATWTPDGRSVTVKGHCPACGGTTSAEFTPGLVGSKGIRGISPPRPPVLPAPVTLYCECGHVHSERPPDAPDRGCGRFWPVYLPDDVRRPPVAGPPHP
jgi:hypothetical protein